MIRIDFSEQDGLDHNSGHPSALIISPSKTQGATGVRGKNAHQSNKLREAHRGDSSGGRSYDQGPSFQPTTTSYA